MQRILRLVGVLGALAVLVVGASIASASPGPVAKAAGGGGGNCNDRWPPRSNWGNGWWQNGNGGRNWNGWGDGNGSFDGNASDHGCGGSGSAVGLSAASGKVHYVRVAIDRINGSNCQNVNSSGSFGATTSCGNRHWMKAKGTSHWRFDIPKRLPAGRYRLRRSAVDAAGNRERPARMDLRIR